MNRIVHFVICFLFSLELFGQTSIPSTLFGQNAWYIDVDELDELVFSSAFDARLDDIEASGVKYVRIGGIDPNWIPIYSFDASEAIDGTDVRLIHLITEIRNHNMHPIIQVGFNPTCHVSPDDYGALAGRSQTEQATIAGNLVAYINANVSPDVTYWIIGNEPDLGLNNCDDPRGYGYNGSSGTHAGLIESYIQEFAIAMKNADPAIKIIGPELATFGNDSGWDGNILMSDLIDDASIMGTSEDAGASYGEFFVDVVSFHYYPDLSTRASVIADPTNTTNGFKHNVSSVGLTGKTGIVQMIGNTSRTVSDLGIGCTEFNLENAETGYDESIPTEFADMIKGYGNRSFLGGQWMAEVFGEGMNSPYMQFMNPWSVKEDGIVGTGCEDGKGYISSCGSTNLKRPTYWHYSMVANNFEGTFYPNLFSNSANYKGFGYKNTTAGEFGVLIMNQNEQSAPRGEDKTLNSFYINFNNTTPVPSADMKFVFNGSASAIGQYGCTIPKETTMLLVFSTSTGNLIRPGNLWSSSWP